MAAWKQSWVGKKTLHDCCTKTWQPVLSQCTMLKRGDFITRRCPSQVPLTLQAFERKDLKLLHRCTVSTVVCPLHGYEKWAFFYVMEAKNGHFSVFSTSWKIHWSKFFSRSHQKNFMIFDHNLWKFHQNR